MLNTEKVKEIMRAQKLNTSQLAKKIGISPQHLSNILGGTRGISTESLKALAMALETDIADILGDSLTNESEFSIHEDGRIIVEKINRTRVTLPSNEQSYRFVKQLVTDNEELDNKILKLLSEVNTEMKEKILKILEAEKNEAE